MSAQQPQRKYEEQLAKKSFFQRVRELSASIPQEEWEKLPKDLARNYKHYLYGHPKEE
jgi:hypothetical protein